MTTSGVLILVTMAVWLAWDLFAFFTGRQTESTWVREVSRRPALPFCGGVVVGHWWFT